MKRIQRLVTVALIAVISCSVMLSVGFSGVAGAVANTCTWTGSGGDLKFSTAANWSGCNSAAPLPGDNDNLVFNIQTATSNTYTITNDITGFAANSLSFTGTNASGFGIALSGNLITLTGGVTNTSSSGSTSIPVDIETPLVISGNQTFNITTLTNVQELQGSGNVNVTGGNRLALNGTGSSQALGSYTGTISSSDSVIELDTFADFTSSGSVVVSGTAALDLFDENGGKAATTVTYNLPISLGGTGVGKFGALNLDGGQDSAVTNNLAGPVTLTSDTDVTADGSNKLNITGSIAYNGHSLSSAGANVTTITVPAGADRSSANANVGNNVTYVVDGKLGSTTVSSGGTLKGAGGTLSSLVLNGGGTVSPGHSPGCLTVSGNLSGAGTYQEEIQSPGQTACTDYDVITVAGTVDLTGSTLSTLLLSNFAPTVGQSYKMIDNQGTGPINGTFSGLAEGAIFTVGSTKLQVTYKGGDGNDVVLTVLSPSTAPTVKAPDTGLAAITAHPLASLLLTFIASTTLLIVARRLKPAYAKVTKR